MEGVQPILVPPAELPQPWDLPADTEQRNGAKQESSQRDLTMAVGPAKPPRAVGPCSRAQWAPEELRCFLPPLAKDDFSGWLACTGRGECAAPGSWHEESWHGAHSGPSPLSAQARVAAKKLKNLWLEICVDVVVGAE